MTAVVVPAAEAPEVSVVMVTYGGGELGVRAIAAVVEHTDVPHEVIIVDNASTDGSADLLEARVKGATIVRNEHNAGFAAACNQGAARATGRFVCFLNPDAFVEAGWLEPLLRRLRDERDVACVVPRLMNADGTLQEAGSLIGREGATWAMGQGAGAADLQHRFALDVPFGSAACMLVRRAAFDAVGGFDAAYWPAYGEDADLCLSLAERGWRTVLEPASSVQHVRSGTGDVRSADRLIRTHRPVLLRRWWGRLAGLPWLEEPAYFPHRVIAARDHDVVDRVLILADGIDGPAGDLAERLAGRPIRVTVAVAAGADERAERLAGLGVEVASGVEDWAGWFEARRFQTSVVVSMTDRFDALVASTQPQAERWVPHPGDDLSDGLAAAGVAFSS